MQIIARYTIADAEARPAEQADTALRWLESYAREQMRYHVDSASRVPGLPLWRLL
ncbi:MAG: hypothetical protein ACRDN9_18970 [Streptosporangiaceae bacterium]